MLRQGLDYLRGTLRVELVSAEPGQALTYYAAHGIRYTSPDLTAPLTVQMTLPPGQWPAFAAMAQKRGDKCRILSRRGLWVTLRSGRKRLLFWLTLAGLCVLTLYGPRRVWFVEVEGNVNVPDREILAAAEVCGVHFWAETGEIRSEKVKNQILNLVPELQWAGVNFSGGVAVISVRERVEGEPVRQRDTITDVVASRDGIVVSMSVLGGQSLCKVGQAVRAGELLVTGVVEHEYRIQYTHADAEIYALTQHEIQAVFPTQWQQKVYTGRQWQCVSLVVGRKRIKIWGNSGIPQGTCDKMTETKTLTLPGDYALPVRLVTETYREYTTETVELPAEAAETVLAGVSAELVQQEMLAGQILHRQADLSQKDGLICLDTVFSCREMIARQREVKLFEGDANE